jgi:hypothetical protein
VSQSPVLAATFGTVHPLAMAQGRKTAPMLAYCQVSMTKQFLDRQSDVTAGLGIPIERTFTNKEAARASIGQG